MIPYLSVVLPVYNQEEFLAETIESVLAQTYSNFEFLILDDGSTDHSAAIIREYEGKDSRIKAFFQENSGKCVATNSLVARARGEVCAFLDADDVMYPTRLEKQVDFLQKNPEIDAVSCQCHYINEKGRLLGKQYYPGLESAEDCKEALARNELVQCSFTGLMATKKSFMDLEGLRSPFWPAEDFDFFNRLIEKGYFLVIIPETLMKYRIHSSSVTVKSPMHVYDKSGWIYQCTALRREGKPEISFKDFMMMRQKESLWIRFNRNRFIYSQIYFRQAGIFIMSGKYVSFVWKAVLSSLLSPSHMLMKLNRLAKR